MATNHTEKYELNQWLPTDPVIRTDFNEDNAKIEAALDELRNTIISGELLMLLFEQYDEKFEALEARISALES